MTNLNRHSIKRRLILLGGGHAHAVLLRDSKPSFFHFYDVSLISQSEWTLYSGMMTGALAGIYEWEQIQIDIRRLCQKRGVRFLKGRVKALELNNSALVTEDGGSHKFDVLSVDTGSESDPESLSGAIEHGFPIRPFKTFDFRLSSQIQRLRSKNAVVNIVQIGGGAAGCECAAAIVAKLRRASVAFKLTLIEQGERLVSEAPPKLSRQISDFLHKNGVTIRLNSEALELCSGQVKLKSGETLLSDFTSLALPPRAGKWLRESGLALSERGFLLTNSYLQTPNANIFAAGDVAEIMGKALPKAGVFAIREAAVLGANLRAHAEGHPLMRYEPQKAWLSLISDGAGKAFGYRGGICFPHAELTWRLKDFMDRRFMSSFP
jgi:selenide,water dikinase